MSKNLQRTLVVTFWAISFCCLGRAQTARTNNTCPDEPRSLGVSRQSAFRPLKVSNGVVRFSGRLELVFSTPAKSDDLCFAVGQPVTLRGEFSLRGKMGPFVMVGGRGVYLIASGSFSWGPHYESMEGKMVTITGTLRFYKAPPAPAGPLAEARVPDHYYMEAEGARVELVK